jgi:hypothetical protein
VPSNINRTLADSREMQNSFANGLGWNGSGVDADAADAVRALDDSYGFSEFSGVEGGLLAGGA